MKKLIFILLLIFGCAGLETKPDQDLDKILKDAEQTKAKWSTYGDMGSGTVLDADTILIRDVNDTSMAATGTQKQYKWSDLKTDITTGTKLTPSTNVLGGDNTLLRADGASRNVQETGIEVDDDDNISNVKSLGMTLVEDPKWTYNALDADDTDWTTGVNADAGASSDDYYEIRQHETPGNKLTVTIDPETGDQRWFGIPGGTNGDDAYYVLWNLANPTAVRTYTLPDLDVDLGNIGSGVTPSFPGMNLTGDLILTEVTPGIRFSDTSDIDGEVVIYANNSVAGKYTVLKIGVEDFYGENQYYVKMDGVNRFLYLAQDYLGKVIINSLYGLDIYNETPNTDQDKLFSIGDDLENRFKTTVDLKANGLLVSVTKETITDSVVDHAGEQIFKVDGETKLTINDSGIYTVFKNGAADARLVAIDDQTSVGSDVDPFVLIDSELFGGIFTNLIASGAYYYLLPSPTTGMNAKFNINVAQNIYLKPPSGTKFYYKDHDHTGFTETVSVDKDIECDISVAIGDRVFIEARKIASTMRWFVWSDTNSCTFEAE